MTEEMILLFILAALAMIACQAGSIEDRLIETNEITKNRNENRS